MFSDPTPRHFISYSAADQQTIRQMDSEYDGILVPGTVASFQRGGTAGFVLTMSAKYLGRPYIIDPRFPLFQQSLLKVKKSHSELASIFDDIDLINTSLEPVPDDFDDSRIASIAAAWVKFNLSYSSKETAKFKKYADRLGRSLDPADAHGPQRILAPYFSVTDLNDGWSRKSAALYHTTRDATDGQLEVTRVLAAESPLTLQQLIDDSESDNVCIWVSGLGELTATAEDLYEYGRAVQMLKDSNRRSFALYGGFFSVLLSALGLGGSSHGIGYGEARAWRELPQSGPPPARYYLPTVHRSVSQDNAQQLWQHDPRLVGDTPDTPPVGLGYHDLKLRSVRARHAEIGIYSSLGLAASIVQLQHEYDDFRSRLRLNSPGRFVSDIGRRAVEHIPRWLQALRRHID